jgi:YD repeat-containing protein
VVSSTDEEGRVTTFTRNARGQATQTVQASGTAAARTINQTWHPTLNAPTEVVESGKTTNYSYGP